MAEKTGNKLTDNTRRAITYITHDIWVKHEHEYRSSKVRWLVRQAKVVLYTVAGIGQHNTIIRSAALTFYTIMAIVPILALAFAIAKGFGLEQSLNDYLYSELPDYTSLTDQILTFANNMLDRTRGGIIASVGVLVLFWSVLKVFNNIEKSFNSIWEVRKSRSITRKFTDYLAVIMVAPILLIMSASAGIYVKGYMSDFTPYFLVQGLFYLLSMIMMWLLFTFLYMVMPNTRVKFRSAFTGAVIAGTAFMIFQSIYFNLQTMLSNYNAIYGTFAAIPLFLIWLQTSWQIVLFGAELSFANQNINKYELERAAGSMSYQYRKKVIIAVMYEIAHHFLKHDGAVTSERIADMLDLPLRIVRDTIYSLLKADFIVPIAVDSDEKTHHYIPSRDMNNIRIFDIIKGVEALGSDTMNMAGNPKLEPISRIVQHVDDSVLASADNILLLDLKMPR